MINWRPYNDRERIKTGPDAHEVALFYRPATSYREERFLITAIIADNLSEYTHWAPLDEINRPMEG